MSRSTGAVGLSYVEAMGAGRFATVHISEEVTRAYREIERDFPNLRCSWDKENREHMVHEYCKDGEHRLVFASRHFQPDLVREMIHRADSDKFDPVKEIEEAEKQQEREHEARMHDLVGDVGEKLAFAFAQDGLTVRPRMAPLSVRLHRKRTLRNFEAPTRTIGNR